MSLMKKDEFNFPVVGRFFDDFFTRELNQKNQGFNYSTLPAVNIKEDENGFIVEMAAPGMKKDDFKIELNQNILSISSELESENKEENERYTRREFSYRSFSRSFNLPDTVDSEKIEAKYKEGVLMLNIPKKEEAKPKSPRFIKIG
jgi:HSP20 family protein